MIRSVEHRADESSDSEDEGWYSLSREFYSDHHHHNLYDHIPHGHNSYRIPSQGNLF